MTCPLCLSEETALFREWKDTHFGARRYWRCPECRLIYLHPDGHLTFEQEKARYDLHQNFPEDPKYVQFLKKLADPLSQKLRAGSCGLDYGCGSGPAMKGILEAGNVSVEHYDPYYFPDGKVLEREYDFITCTEVIEHFRKPREEFEKLNRLLRRGVGVLGVMTEMLEDEENFSNWWYPRDPTHIAFYQKKTLGWIAGEFAWGIEFPCQNVVLFSK
ncbi:MAG: class I SAM-dependent methyltransferase [Candidatus Omnitrophica bacterium]|nr:class I SAM-dependent methyltransferase [Candidatus Omnitrophota bacterium]